MVLQSPTVPELVDSFGQPQKNWTTIGTYSLYLRPLSTKEAAVARQIKAEATHNATTRWLGNSVQINPTCRFVTVDGKRVFGIVQVLNVEERNRQYEMILMEIQQTGAL